MSPKLWGRKSCCKVRYSHTECFGCESHLWTFRNLLNVCAVQAFQKSCESLIKELLLCVTEKVLHQEWWPGQLWGGCEQSLLTSLQCHSMGINKAKLWQLFCWWLIQLEPLVPKTEELNLTLTWFPWLFYATPPSGLCWGRVLREEQASISVTELLCKKKIPQIYSALYFAL